MNMKEIKEIAAQNGIKAGKMKKTELIRAIQDAEGNVSCFETERVNTCGEDNCWWKDDW